MENQKKEETKETTFENAKVGDKVWSIRYGWGDVLFLPESGKYIRIKFKDIEVAYTIDGKNSLYDPNQSLFWNEIKFEVPTRPKRLVKKTITKYLNVYPDHVVTWDSELSAESNATSNAVGVAVEFNYNYIVEE